MVAARAPSWHPSRGYTCATRGVGDPHLGLPSIQPVSDDSPLATHAASPSELQERLSAERAGAPFLVLRDGQGRQRLRRLEGQRLSIGRGETNDVPLPWDTEVSRLHAELESIAGEWTIVDDGLSKNGTFVNGVRVSGRARLRDGDVVRIGRTTIAYVRPDTDESRDHTVVASEALTLHDLPPTQRQVLTALARPYKHSEFATPATNQHIADELHLSVDAVKAHLRTLFQRFGIEQLPQNQKRSQLVAEAFQRGLLTQRDL
jgi:pSer/pThr/pTyr-binding forkhead associated (FHA) protein